MIIILTAREPEAKDRTESFLSDNHVRYNKILFGIPMGERILMNDTKPSGLRCAYAVCPDRNGDPLIFLLILTIISNFEGVKNANSKAYSS